MMKETNEDQAEAGENPRSRSAKCRPCLEIINQPVLTILYMWRHFLHQHFKDIPNQDKNHKSPVAEQHAPTPNGSVSPPDALQDGGLLWELLIVISSFCEPHTKHENRTNDTKVRPVAASDLWLVCVLVCSTNTSTIYSFQFY